MFHNFQVHEDSVHGYIHIFWIYESLSVFQSWQFSKTQAITLQMSPDSSLPSPKQWSVDYWYSAVILHIISTKPGFQADICSRMVHLWMEDIFWGLCCRSNLLLPSRTLSRKAVLKQLHTAYIEPQRQPMPATVSGVANEVPLEVKITRLFRIKML